MAKDPLKLVRWAMALNILACALLIAAAVVRIVFR